MRTTQKKVHERLVFCMMNHRIIISKFTELTVVFVYVSIRYLYTYNGPFIFTASKYILRENRHYFLYAKDGNAIEGFTKPWIEFPLSEKYLVVPSHVRETFAVLLQLLSLASKYVNIAESGNDMLGILVQVAGNLEVG